MDALKLISDSSLKAEVPEINVGSTVRVHVKIREGEKVALIGRNGCGKTTLFKILTGEMDYDDGEVFVNPHKRIGLISQIPKFPYGYTVEDVLRSAFSRVQKLAEEMAQLETLMAAGESDPDILRRYGSLL